MVGFTPPYCPLMPYKWGGLLWSLLRNPKEQWLRVYGCPEEMPGAARLPNNLELDGALDRIECPPVIHDEPE